MSEEDAVRAPVFRVEVRQEDATVRAILYGELDMTGTGALETTLGGVRTGTCVLDMRHLTFLDSAGIHVLMRLDTRSRAEGWNLAITGATGAVARVLALCRVGDRIPITDGSPGTA
jgi:anti-anti-sigma factor